MEQYQLFSLLAKSLAYAGVVYRQSTYLGSMLDFENEFKLEFKHESMPEDSLLFFVPSVSANDSADCVLNVRLPFVSPQDGTTVRYSDNRYPIFVETTDGVYRRAGSGDIVANRMCVFRFDPISKRAILINSPLYNSAAYNSITVTDASFINRPKVRETSTVGGYVELATMADIATLLTRIEQLENKVIWGTEDPDEALADRPTGTIYIQVQGD